MQHFCYNYIMHLQMTVACICDDLYLNANIHKVPGHGSGVGFSSAT